MAAFIFHDFFIVILICLLAYGGATLFLLGALYTNNIFDCFRR